MKLEDINIEEYIKDLSPELQEQARSCSSIDELLKLAKENKIPLPDDALEAVAGGKGKQQKLNVVGEMPVDFPCWCVAKSNLTEDLVKYPFAKKGNIVYAMTKPDGYFWVYRDELCLGDGLRLYTKSQLLHYSYPEYIV